MVITVYVTNKKASKYMMQKLTELNGETENSQS